MVVELNAVIVVGVPGEYLVVDNPLLEYVTAYSTAPLTADHSRVAVVPARVLPFSGERRLGAAKTVPPEPVVNDHTAESGPRVVPHMKYVRQYKGVAGSKLTEVGRHWCTP